VVDGPTWKFIIWPPFQGPYNADEPAEDYSYDVSFVKVNLTTIRTDNYWNSGWTAIFNLDYTANTYKMDSTSFGGTVPYSAVEAGTIDQSNGKMVGDYKIYHGALGTAPIEVGVHTYTKL
jgi:hypothetical protein